MDTNPYRPPATELRDPPRAPAAPPPLAVRSACLLVLASLALGLLTLAPGMRAPEPGLPDMFAITVGAYIVFGGLTLWFVRRTWQGRNWARWALLVYLALGWALYAATLADEMTTAPMAALVNMVCVVMEATACGLLFMGTGGRWFACVRNATPGS